MTTTPVATLAAVRAPLVLAILAGLLLLAVSPAQAALPKPGAAYMVHDHSTPGDNWHVEAKVTKRGRGFESLLVHSDRCGETPFAQRVPVGADGSSKTYRPIDPADPEKGSWYFQARFTETHRLDGFFRIVTPTCDTGNMVFVAHSGNHAGHAAYGHPAGTMPSRSAIANAKPKRVAQAKAILRASWRAAKNRFRTLVHANRLGYRAYASVTADRRPILFHVRKDAYNRDGYEMNAGRVESLVYYRGARGPSVLVAFMYRKPAGGWPAFARPLMAWHGHGNGKSNQMTHVWLTRDLRSALANCMPVEQLEAALPDFEYVPTNVGIAESKPCPADA